MTEDLTVASTTTIINVVSEFKILFVCITTFAIQNFGFICHATSCRDVNFEGPWTQSKVQFSNHHSISLSKCKMLTVTGVRAVMIITYTKMQRNEIPMADAQLQRCHPIYKAMQIYGNDLS
mmetsp:Transcript_3777/g.8419  ORF Transcript_3777/g.8419 Transcript_3777/m.8419 type:complete len:121 (-) Transcript_3777:243-605(-)